MNRRALITGASGFMGQHLCSVLQAKGYVVSALSRAGTKPKGVSENIELGDILDQANLVASLEQSKPDIVFHLAGTANASVPAELYRVNTLFGLALARAASMLPEQPAFVVAGSVAEYGLSAASLAQIPETAVCNPTSVYGISKLAQTLHCLAEYRSRTVVARLFNPIGPGMRGHLALASFAEQLNAMGPAGGELRTGPLAATRDFIDARDTATRLADLAETQEAFGSIVNLCSGTGTSLREIVEEMIIASAKPVSLVEDASRGSVTSGHIDRAVGDPGRLRSLGLEPPALDVRKLAASLTEHSKTT